MKTNAITKKIDENYKSLLTELEYVVTEIADDSSEKMIFMLLDKIINKLIENYSFENRILQSAEKGIYSEHIEEHNMLTTTCMDIFRVKKSNVKAYHKLIKIFIDQFSDHYSKFDKQFMDENDDRSSFIVQQKHHGCILFVVCEFGYLIKVYGEISEELLSEMVNKARAYRDDLYYSEVSWGEIIDFRTWDLLTSNSMNIAKSNSKKSNLRNKKYTIYVTGESKINEFIARSIEKDSTILSFNVNDLYGIVSILNKQEFSLGKVINYDSVGNTNCIK